MVDPRTIHVPGHHELTNEFPGNVAGRFFGQTDLKIGIHKGRFLCRMASQLPERFFIGVECKEAESKHAAARVSSRRLDNVSVVNMEAHRYVADYVPDAAFQTVHIYFPTPYPRTIGLSDRLVTAAFTAELARILKPDGQVRIVTDHSKYYEAICRQFAAGAWWIVDWQRLELGQPEDWYVGSPCEIDYRSKGAPIYALQLWRQ
jgi:tRNA G46 methylase TrmB